jgi:hypothetical protein
MSYERASFEDLELLTENYVSGSFNRDDELWSVADSVRTGVWL